MVEAGMIPGAMTLERRRELLRTKGHITVMPPDGGPLSWNDLGNAERFLSSFGDELGYCVESGEWMIYTGRHWQKDNIFYVSEYAREFVKDELSEAVVSGDKYRIKNADRLNNKGGFTAMFDMAKQLRAVSISEFDGPATHYKLNCKNGTLDLRTGELADHNADDRITRFIDVDYNADAAADNFDKFLEKIQPDAAVRAFLQRSIGYSMLGAVPDAAFWILYGIGNNGKSVFTKLFMDLLGDYSSGVASQTIMEAKRAAGAASPDLARLKGKRFVVVAETNENERLNPSLIKALSAGDVITARHLFQGEFDFPFSGKMWIATNHKPSIIDHSNGMWRRLILVPFAVNIPDGEVIPQDQMLARLMAERSGILSWAVQGARDYFEHGLAVPPVIQAEIDQYKFEQDSIAQFLEECCQTAAQFHANCEAMPEDRRPVYREREFETANADLYDAYVKFCKSTGEYQRTQRRLSQNMKERGFVQTRQAKRLWHGIRLLEGYTPGID